MMTILRGFSMTKTFKLSALLAVVTLVALVLVSASSSASPLPQMGSAHYYYFFNLTANDGDVASAYPANINVSGLGGTITDVNVTLLTMNDDQPEDLDVLLVSPSGSAVMLMSDACGTQATIGAQMTFDQQASATLVDGAPCISMTLGHPARLCLPISIRRKNCPPLPLHVPMTHPWMSTTATTPMVLVGLHGR